MPCSLEHEAMRQRWFSLALSLTLLCTSVTSLPAGEIDPSTSSDPPPKLSFRPSPGNTPDKARIDYGNQVVAWARRHQSEQLTLAQKQGELSNEEIVLMKAREEVAKIEDDDGDRMGQAQRAQRAKVANNLLKAAIYDLLTFGTAAQTPSALKAALKSSLAVTVIDGDGNAAWRRGILADIDGELTSIANQRIAYHNEIVDTRTPLINEYRSVKGEEAARWQGHLAYVAKREAAEYLHQLIQQTYRDMAIQSRIGQQPDNGAKLDSPIPPSIALEHKHSNAIPPYLRQNPLPATLPKTTPTQSPPEIRLN